MNALKCRTLSACTFSVYILGPGVDGGSSEGGYFTRRQSSLELCHIVLVIHKAKHKVGKVLTLMVC